MNKIRYFWYKCQSSTYLWFCRNVNCYILEICAVIQQSVVHFIHLVHLYNVCSSCSALFLSCLATSQKQTAIVQCCVVLCCIVNKLNGTKFP